MTAEQIHQAKAQAYAIMKPYIRLKSHCYEDAETGACWCGHGPFTYIHRRDS